MHTTLFGMVARPRWGWLVVLATTSACVTQAIGDQEPPPTVADVTPRQGEYGALLTVHGEHLERSTVMGRAPDGTPVTLARPLAPPAGAKSDGSTKGAVVRATAAQATALRRCSPSAFPSPPRAR